MYFEPFQADAHAAVISIQESRFDILQAGKGQVVYDND